jgi:hypothetical protein
MKLEWQKSLETILIIRFEKWTIFHDAEWENKFLTLQPTNCEVTD